MGVKEQLNRAQQRVVGLLSSTAMIHTGRSGTAATEGGSKSCVVNSQENEHFASSRLDKPGICTD